jgi:hypothetical protein
MIAYAHLAGHNHIVFDGHAAGKAGLRGDDYILSDLAVVADVDEVVDFRSAADSCFVQGSAVNSRVSADFYIVFDYKASDLGGLLVTSGLLVADIAETLAAEDGSGLHDDPVA